MRRTFVPLALASAATLGACSQALKFSKDDSTTVLAQQTITAPNPGDPGPYKGLRLYYGSGNDKQRREFRDSVTYKTKPVDVSPYAQIQPEQAADRKDFWGFDLKQAPLNARVWYPDGAGPFPLVLVVHPSIPVRSVREFVALSQPRKGGFVYGSTGAGQSYHLNAAAISSASGLNLLHVPYKGLPGAMTALAAGQLDLAITNLATGLPLLKDGKINLIAQIGLTKEKELPNVPLLMDLGPTAEDRAALKLLSSVTAVGRPLFTSPGTPPERVAALRRAFDLTIKDPAYIADLQKINLALNPMGGEELQKIVEETVNTPKPIVERLIKAIEGRDVRELKKDDAPKGAEKGAAK